MLAHMLFFMRVVVVEHADTAMSKLVYMYCEVPSMSREDDVEMWLCVTWE